MLEGDLSPCSNDSCVQHNAKVSFGAYSMHWHGQLSSRQHIATGHFPSGQQPQACELQRAKLLYKMHFAQPRERNCGHIEATKGQSIPCSARQVGLEGAGYGHHGSAT